MLHKQKTTKPIKIKPQKIKFPLKKSIPFPFSPLTGQPLKIPFFINSFNESSRSIPDKHKIIKINLHLKQNLRPINNKLIQRLPIIKNIDNKDNKLTLMLRTALRLLINYYESDLGVKGIIKNGRSTGL